MGTGRRCRSLWCERRHKACTCPHGAPLSHESAALANPTVAATALKQRQAAGLAPVQAAAVRAPCPVPRPPALAAVAAAARPASPTSRAAGPTLGPPGPPPPPGQQRPPPRPLASHPGPRTAASLSPPLCSPVVPACRQQCSARNRAAPKGNGELRAARPLPAPASKLWWQPPRKSGQLLETLTPPAVVAEPCECSSPHRARGVARHRQHRVRGSRTPGAARRAATASGPRKCCPHYSGARNCPQRCSWTSQLWRRQWPDPPVRVRPRASRAAGKWVRSP
mmetsp:Transcript_3480/g.10799  ORF Transcript_3480/g.10799 Transcript_3480/m.10799 type:complete len:280 (+) Transcript_3480:295-1134(+)